MIERQLKPRGIDNEQVLPAFYKVPREEFVPDKFKGRAYDDRPLPIGEGQTISQPYIVARMVEVIEPKPEDKVLEIGFGSGYAAAILAEIVDRVHGIERKEELAEAARNRLEKLGYENVEFRVGDGTKGWPEPESFNGIIVSAAAPEVPEPLVKQLAPGGRLVLPVGDKNVQTLYRIRKTEEGEVKKEKLSKVRFVPLIGEYGWEA
jgi:protein-L-isoaspartate(D-aspartate) O-methyltransferase